MIHAVEDGKKVADEIDEFLLGEQRLKTHVGIEMTDANGETGRLRDHDVQLPVHIPHTPVPGRDGDKEVEMGFDDEMTGINATRCYFCHYKFEIDQEKCIHCDWCIKVSPRDCIKKVSRLFHDEDGAVKMEVESDLSKDATYIWIDSNECIRCGKCLRICPTDAITMRKMSLERCKVADIKDRIKKNVVDRPTERLRSL